MKEFLSKVACLNIDLEEEPWSCPSDRGKKIKDEPWGGLMRTAEACARGSRDIPLMGGK